ncbi:Translation elongation factor IF5A-like protein [Aduncisulcus paluster]|uniref:Eukaryotic translation initiation factor 5A n=2 Tax=Aduncisulcus paluster TaxID=2918883 RepID=A0ABQ5JV25_9EUKA|nr:Translation elongation factor IF5A-like protein [Aduncisulcus paluster]
MDETFEKAGSGASLTYPVAAGQFRKGHYAMLKQNPCKITDISISKTGKHGHAKARIVGINIFTGVKYEDVCGTTHNMEAPHVDKKEYELVDIDEAQVILMDTDGEPKEDLNLPPGDLAEELKKAHEEVQDDDGKSIMVCVLAAMAKEQIISFRVVTSDE